MLLFPPGSGEDMNYAVVMIGGVFVFASTWWMLSAKKWFHGPITNVDGSDKAGKNITPENRSAEQRSVSD
ncbi:hypothetical protein GYMLUDRAFT_240422 [Collybiopsis luxurians FD-317 M1]|nr:hypothetical protein GYMLUDRAFT_240422 [Collybiopsis luxurians FD-317 M1]